MSVLKNSLKDGEAWFTEDGDFIFGIDPVQGKVVVAADGLVDQRGKPVLSTKSLHVTLTDAQIKAAPTAGLIPVLAASPNKIFIPTLGVMFLDPCLADYTNLDSPQFNVKIGSNDAWLSNSCATCLAGQTDAARNILIQHNTAALRVAINTLVNQAINIVLANGSSGDLTGGDPGNVLHVAIDYFEYIRP